MVVQKRSEKRQWSFLMTEDMHKTKFLHWKRRKEVERHHTNLIIAQEVFTQVLI